MKTCFSLLLASLCFLASVVPLSAQSSAFTYQGRLTSGTSPASGSYDFQFTLFGAESGGNPVEDPVTASAVGVTNGLFTVPLDFGPNVFTGADRWLDIAVRPAGNGPFTPLLPRQPITAAPYALTALTALSVPGVDGHSLDAPGGGPANAVLVNNSGSVGIGTTNPVTRLHVASGPGENAPPRIESSGTSGFAAGWDFYLGTVGKGYVGVPDASAIIAPGEMLVYGGPGTKASLWGGGVRALTADTAGNVRLGPNGQFHAASGDENLRIVRGVVSRHGTILRGSGFQVTHDPGQVYRITFTTPFPEPPVVTGTPVRGGVSTYVMVNAVTATRVDLLSYSIGDFGGDEDFHFIAIGLR